MMIKSADDFDFDMQQMRKVFEDGDSDSGKPETGDEVHSYEANNSRRETSSSNKSSSSSFRVRGLIIPIQIAPRIRSLRPQEANELTKSSIIRRSVLISNHSA